MSQETRSAAEAFDALREEVGKLRSGMELIYRQGQEIKTASKPIDYNPTLSEMAKSLGAIEGGLADVKHRIPPVSLPGKRFLPHELVAITEQAQDAALELRKAADVVVKQHAARWWIAGACGLGIVLGITLCIGIAALFPQSAGSWVAAAIVGGNP